MIERFIEAVYPDDFTEHAEDTGDLLVGDYDPDDSDLPPPRKMTDAEMTEELQRLGFDVTVEEVREERKVMERGEERHT